MTVNLPPEVVEGMVKGALLVLDRLPELVRAVRESSLSDERKATLLKGLEAAQARVEAAVVR